jgi:hypothetical protein
MLPREDFMIPFELQHRHSDGTAHRMERKPANPEDHDPETTWLRPAEFRCVDCPEVIALIPGEKT